MKSFKFHNKITISEIEDLYSKLNDSEFEHADFIVSNESDYRGFGIIPYMVLFFFKWLRHSKSGELIIAIKADNKEAVEEFATNFLGYTILTSAWKHKEIVDEDRVPLKNYFRPFTKELHRRIDFLQDLPNNNILIPLFDHYSKPQGLSHWFYDDSFKFIGSPKELSNTVYRIFQEVGRIFRARLVKNTNIIIEDLDIIIWELVKNTNDHATKDYLNKTELSPNTRGVYLKIHRSSKNNFVTEAKNNPGLKTYFENVLLEGDEGNKGNNFLLEISVFDTGPGMSKRFLGEKWVDNISPNEEVDILRKCLCKGMTSTEGIQGNNRGYGLNNVLMTLSSKKGFLKIRTGNVSVYRDLQKSPHFEATEYNRIELQDWDTNSPSTFTSKGNSIGTLLTMIYPLM
jgi:hypothetical protein